jgi:hypothetical protein
MLLFRLAVFLWAIQTVTAFSCTKKFWPKFNPGENFTINAQCQYYPGYPRQIGSTTVSVAYTDKWGNNARAKNIFNKVGPDIDEALTNSLDLYAKFAKVPAEIVVILSRRQDKPAMLWTIFPAPNQPRCQVTAFESFTDFVTSSSSTSNGYAKQALAHELYHCVQQYSIGVGVDTKLASSGWVIEGSAHYFSNVVYPNANLEWPGVSADQNYQPARPIYDQGVHVYGTSLYFQSLEQKTPATLSNWVLATKLTKNGLAERTRLSALSGFTDDFWEFAQQLSLGKIVDTNTQDIPRLPTITPSSVSITGKPKAALLKTTPFTVSVFQISPEAGSTVQLTAPEYTHQRVAYRLPSVKTWTAVATLPRTVEVSCTDPTILLLFISTKNADTDEVKVSVTKTRSSRKRADQCGDGGAGFVLYPLRDPETLSAYCPDGTHGSRVAAWCCPDGSELNEEHAAEASVCCPKTREYSTVFFMKPKKFSMNLPYTVS